MQLNLPRPHLDDRLALQQALDRLNRQIDASGDMAGLDEFRQQTLDLVLGRAHAAFDLSLEDPRLLRRYDTGSYMTGISRIRPSTQGRQLLMARRLSEAGCGFVTIHNPGWDMHGGPKQLKMPRGMGELGRPLDQAVSAFVEDVHQRELSDNILLIIIGEFGRTPRVKDNGGHEQPAAQWRQQ